MNKLESKFQEIRYRVGKATPKPWAHRVHGFQDFVFAVNGDAENKIVADNFTPDDAEFVAMARADIELLLEIAELLVPHIHAMEPYHKQRIHSGIDKLLESNTK